MTSLHILTCPRCGRPGCRYGGERCDDADATPATCVPVTTHVLKSWPQFFDPISRGMRTHELRRNDRQYRIGDFLELREFCPERASLTGRVCVALITSLTSPEMPCAVSAEALAPGFCILSIKVVCEAVVCEAI